MRIYICTDLGSVYRLKKSVLEYAPLFIDDTFNTKDFAPVDEAVNGDEIVRYCGTDMTMDRVYRLIKIRLFIRGEWTKNVYID